MTGFVSPYHGVYRGSDRLDRAHGGLDQLVSGK